MHLPFVILRKHLVSGCLADRPADKIDNLSLISTRTRLVLPTRNNYTCVFSMYVLLTTFIFKDLSVCKFFFLFLFLFVPLIVSVGRRVRKSQRIRLKPMLKLYYKGQLFNIVTKYCNVCMELAPSIVSFSCVLRTLYPWIIVFSVFFFLLLRRDRFFSTRATYF